MARLLTTQEMVAEIGEVIGISDWLLIDQERINRFADIVEDHAFIHVDRERAAATPFGGTIAHGFLTLSLMTAFMARADLPEPVGLNYSVNYGSDRVRFLAPVPSGSRIRAQFRLLDFAEKRPGEWLDKRELVIEIEGGSKPALICEWMMLHIF